MIFPRFGKNDTFSGRNFPANVALNLLMSNHPSIHCVGIEENGLRSHLSGRANGCSPLGQ